MPEMSPRMRHHAADGNYKESGHAKTVRVLVDVELKVLGAAD